MRATVRLVCHNCGRAQTIEDAVARVWLTAGGFQDHAAQWKPVPDVPLPWVVTSPMAIFEVLADLLEDVSSDGLREEGFGELADLEAASGASATIDFCNPDCAQAWWTTLPTRFDLYPFMFHEGYWPEGHWARNDGRSDG